MPLSIPAMSAKLMVARTVFLGLYISTMRSTRGSGTLTTAVCSSNWPLETAAVSRFWPVRALKRVVLPLFGRPMMPKRMGELPRV